MNERGDTDFYASYERFKDYVTPNLEEKQIRRYDRDFWEPAGCTADMAVLEVGCGTGLFLAYLGAKGVGDFLGIEIQLLNGHLFLLRCNYGDTILNLIELSIVSP